MIFADCISTFTTSYGLPVSLFLAGLVGGFTHCAGMCAPFVLAQTDDEMPSLKRLGGALLLPYHLGRMTTYVVLAALLSSLVNLAFLFSDLRAALSALLLMLAGSLFLVSAFPKFSALLPWSVRLQITAPFTLIMKGAQSFMRARNPFKKYILGVILGFMPCALVVSALMAASTAPSVFSAAVAMSAFALGTMPALFMVSLGGHTLKARYPKFSTRFSQGALAISALWLFVLAGTLVF